MPLPLSVPLSLSLCHISISCVLFNSKNVATGDRQFQCKSRTIRMVRDQCTALGTFLPYSYSYVFVAFPFQFLRFHRLLLPKRHDFSLFFFCFVTSVVFIILLYENCCPSSLCLLIIIIVIIMTVISNFELVLLL